jgi:hypothetical protein
MKRYEALAGPWTIRVCPECGRVANACEHVEQAGVEPVEIEVAPSTTTGAVEALRELVDAAEGVTETRNYDAAARWRAALDAAINALPAGGQ